MLDKALWLQSPSAADASATSLVGEDISSMLLMLSWIVSSI